MNKRSRLSKNSVLLNLIFWAVFLIYMFILIDTVFGRRIGISYRDANLVPFESIRRYLRVHDGMSTKTLDVNVWGNVLMFIPLGVFYMSFARRLSYVRTVILLILSSFTIEAVQYIFYLGTFDVDDIILNVAGGIIGIILYRILLALFKTKRATRNIISILFFLMLLPVVALYAVNVWGA